MGFSHRDWQEQQGRLIDINLDRLRFGHRMDPRKQLNVSYLGQQGPPEDQKPEDPGLAKYQLRLW